MSVILSRSGFLNLSWILYFEKLKKVIRALTLGKKCTYVHPNKIVYAFKGFTKPQVYDLNYLLP